MQTLKFLGRGGAFFPQEGNTSAYFIEDNTMYLFDCGETVFATLMENNKLLNLIKDNDVNNIEIYITHLHSDHVGSLSSLIYYCYYVLDIKPKLYYKADSIVGNLLEVMLKLQGHDEHQYVLLDKPAKGIEPIVCDHVDEMLCYHYLITTDDNKKIFYSGDCSVLGRGILNCLAEDNVDEIYLECSTRDSGVHLTLREIEKYKNRFALKNIYLMHIDNLELIEKAKEYNLKVVELDK